MSRILLPKFERYRAVIKETQKWTDKNSLYYKLPEHYKKRHKEFLSTVPKPVHYIKSEKLYEVDHETGTRKMLQDTPIDVLYPTQAKLGLWGGEGIVPGYIRPYQSGYRRGVNYLTTKLWRPRILKMIFYTEILDKYYALTCTRRTLTLIEEAQGFDNYILRTHQVDLKSDIGMQLKREMLIVLAKKETDLYPNDKVKQDLIFNRYKQFLIPLEEAEWIGLKPWEATTKLKKKLQEEEKKLVKPLKYKYIEETLERIQSDPLSIDKIIETNLEDIPKSSGLFKKMWEENKPKFLKK